jgi:diguanylate cyclase
MGAYQDNGRWGMLHIERVVVVSGDQNDYDPEREFSLPLKVKGVDVQCYSALSELTYDVLSQQFDVMFLDVSLAPDGIASIAEDVQHIREYNRTIAIVALLDEEREADILRVLGCGIQDYLIKGQSSPELVIRAARYAIQRKRYEEKVSYLTMQDHLTGLMNGELIPSTLKQAIQSAKREKSLVALYYVDIDNFRDINEQYGHHVGNALLIDVAARLQGVLDDNCTLARLSGDVFVIIDVADDVDACAVLAEEIIQAMRVHTEIGHVQLPLSASIGVATFPQCAVEASELMNHAEYALQIAKKEGKGGYRFYSAGLNEAARKRIHLTRDLKEKLNDEMFSLHYQPKIDLVSGRVIGVEALIRWHHPTYGYIPPDQFIPLAEEAGLIQNVSTWVLHTACKQHQHAQFQHLDVAVNLSAMEMCNPELVSMVQHMLREHNMPPNHLIIEITETAMLSDNAMTLNVMHQLKDIGVKLYMDDFGIGYSSIDYLRRYPLDALKIDRSFVMHMDERKDDQKIVKLMIDIAHELDLRVVAEGLEKEEQLSMLQYMQCDAAQGYFFAKPMSAENFLAWYAQYAPFVHPLRIVK